MHETHPTNSRHYNRVSNIDRRSFRYSYFLVNGIIQVGLVIFLSLSNVLNIPLEAWLLISIVMLFIHISWASLFVLGVHQRTSSKKTNSRHQHQWSLVLAELFNAFGWCVALAIVHASRISISTTRSTEYAMIYLFAQLVVYLQYLLTFIL